MLPTDLEEASDLEWMLLSGQVERATLALALVEQYWSEVSSFSQAILGRSEAANQAVQATFLTALTEAYQYQSSLGVRTWIYLLAINSCRRARAASNQAPNRTAFSGWESGEIPLQANSPLQALGCLSRPDRLAVALVYVSGWQPPDAAKLAGVSDTVIKHALDRFRQLLIVANGSDPNVPSNPDATSDHQLAAWLRLGLQMPAMGTSQVRVVAHRLAILADRQEARRTVKIRMAEVFLVTSVILVLAGLFWGAGGSSPGAQTSPSVVYQTVLVTQTAPPRIVTEIVYVLPTPAFDLAPTDVPEDWFYTVQAGDTAASIANQFGRFTVEELITLNRLTPDKDLTAVLEPGQKLLLPFRAVARHSQPVTPVVPDEIVDYEADDRSAFTSNIPAVYQRLQWLATGWQTLWINAVTIEYDQDGRAIPGRTERTQAWLSGNQLLAINGEDVRGPEAAWLALFDQNKYYVAEPGAGNPWYSEITLAELYASRPVDETLLALFNPFRAEPAIGGRRFEIVRIEQVGSRQARLINQFNREGRMVRQLWIDLETGMVLQTLKYASDGRLSQRLVVTELAVDVDLPQELLTPDLPWRGGYARDYFGRPEGSTGGSGTSMLP